jgi:hypothetical protein
MARKGIDKQKPTSSVWIRSGVVVGSPLNRFSYTETEMSHIRKIHPHTSPSYSCRDTAKVGEGIETATHA